MFRQKTYSRRPKDVTSLKSNGRSCGEQNGKVTSFANYENDENHLSQKVSIKPAKQKKVRASRNIISIVFNGDRV